MAGSPTASKFEAPIGSFGGAFTQTLSSRSANQSAVRTITTCGRIRGASWYNPTDPAPPHGGGDPSTRGTGADSRSTIAIPSNVSTQWFQDHLGFPLVGVDPDLKPFTQEEFTAGFESQLPWGNLILGTFHA